MQIQDILAQAGGVESMARQLGISPSQAQAGASALLPAILGGFQKQAGQSEGGGGLGGLLESLAGGAAQPAPDVNQGNDVLGQIFGSKDVSRTVAQDASSKSGLDPALLKRMLPMLAMLVAAFMARQGGGGGGLGSILGGMLGGGGLGSMLDSNRDGNPLDDILSMARGGMKKS